jgi:predicted nucleic acid-binding protein
MEEQHPCLYLDTNILISYIHEREPASVDLIKKIRLRKWKCFTSSLTALEMYDVEQLENWVQDRRLKRWMFDQIMRNYSRRRGSKLGLTDKQLEAVHITLHDTLISLEDCIEFQRLNDTISITAEQLCATTNVGATDALHLATAMYTKCNILVTNDDDFLGIVNRNNYMLATKAKEFDKALAQYAKLK